MAPQIFISPSDCTDPGFGFETFRLFQGKQKSPNHKWLVSNLFFFFSRNPSLPLPKTLYTCVYNIFVLSPFSSKFSCLKRNSTHVALFLKLHEAEVIFFSPLFEDEMIRRIRIRNIRREAEMIRGTQDQRFTSRAVTNLTTCGPPGKNFGQGGGVPLLNK